MSLQGRHSRCVSIHSWSSYQEKHYNDIPRAGNKVVSIHSWSSYQEKHLTWKDLSSGQGWFQSTPGLVTRRNHVLSTSAAEISSVSIHSWSSYQEKRECLCRVGTAGAFQSTPGLVTRRNTLHGRTCHLARGGFNPLLV